MPRKEKTVKVRLTKKVHSFRLGDVSYKPGAVFECPERLFRPDFMEKVVPSEKKVEIENPIEEPPSEVPSEAVADLSKKFKDVTEEEKGKKKR